MSVAQHTLPHRDSDMLPRQDSDEKFPDDLQRVEKQPSDLEHRDPHDLPPLAKSTQAKLDLRLVPLLCFLYSLSLVDRLNISIARIAGMDTDLNLSIDNRYNIIALSVFPSYLIAEIPANAIFKRLGISPAYWIGGATLCYGLFTMVQAFVTTWSPLIGTRILLGFAEGMFFPACILLICSWYPRHETAKRIAVFYLGGLFLGGGVEQIFSYLFGTIGTPSDSIYGWKYIFLLYGIITIVVSLFAIFVGIPHFPESDRGNKHLSQAELELVRRRIEIDRHDIVAEKLTMSDVVRECLSLRGWLACALFMLSNTPTYAFAYFLPTILKSTLKYSAKDAQLLSAPPYLVGAFFGYLVSVASDRQRVRGLYIIGGSLLSLVGLIMVGYCTEVHVRYAGCYLTLMGCTAANPLIITWGSNNVRTQNGRTINHAQVALGGNMGGIIASLVFRTQDAPGYVPGLLTCLIAEAIIIVISLGMVAYYRTINKKADRGECIIEGHPTFRYTL